MGTCVASLVVRFRRSHGDERQQIKWLLLAGAILVVWLAWPIERGNGGVVDVVQGFILALIPAAVAVGILKYHLYDIDLVIKKTVVFTVVAAVLTALYVGVIAVAALGTVSRLLVAVVLFAVTFNPVRRAARSLADRLVYGKRATSYEVLTDFSERMADTYATDDVLPRMAQILAGATGAATATVWLLVGGELRPAAASKDGDVRTAVRTIGDALPELPDDLAVEVRHHGELLGALSVTMPPNDPMDPGREKLVRDLASQAGLVLRNVRLIEELKASRQRLVAAQDEERRRIERNIHDGAQQQLVALTVKARLAQQFAGTDPAKAADLSGQLQADTSDALENLRDLARGIYPPLLQDKGLVAALEAQARRAAVATDIDGDGVGRFPQDVEAAVYFSCLEALQNVAKYASATRVDVSLSNGRRRAQVRDRPMTGSGSTPRPPGTAPGCKGWPTASRPSGEPSMSDPIPDAVPMSRDGFRRGRSGRLDEGPDRHAVGVAPVVARRGGVRGVRRHRVDRDTDVHANTWFNAQEAIGALVFPTVGAPHRVSAPGQRDRVVVPGPRRFVRGVRGERGGQRHRHVRDGRVAVGRVGPHVELGPGVGDHGHLLAGALPRRAAPESSVAMGRVAGRHRHRARHPGGYVRPHRRWARSGYQSPVAHRTRIGGGNRHDRRFPVRPAAMVGSVAALVGRFRRSRRAMNGCR